MWVVNSPVYFESDLLETESRYFISYNLYNTAEASGTTLPPCVKTGKTFCHRCHCNNFIKLIDGLWLWWRESERDSFCIFFKLANDIATLFLTPNIHKFWRSWNHVNSEPIGSLTTILTFIAGCSPQTVMTFERTFIAPKGLLCRELQKIMCVRRFVRSSVR